MSIRVQTENFDIAHEVRELRKKHPATGAVVTFVGTVRDMQAQDAVISMHLEHYPGMTEKVLQGIKVDAMSRWDLEAVTVIHRIGKLFPSDQIVLVVVCSKHRYEAFRACEYIMDMLKTKAPFWKKEEMMSGSHWVEMKTSDKTASDRWNVIDECNNRC